MNRKRSDNKPDIFPLIDRGENLSLMEPLLISEGSKRRKALMDLAMKLVAKSAGFKNSLPSVVQTSLATMVRGMNCYYSNLIEGHNTHPVEIERALKGDYSADRKKRNLQNEAEAHIAVQTWIDRELKTSAFSSHTIMEIHRRFYNKLPEDLLWVENLETQEKVKVAPGEIRHRDVKVGSHIPVSPGAIARFLGRFESAYSNLSKTDTLLAIAASHHRFLWIHPFLDGNGRVARLMSHAVLNHLLDLDGIWSIARGLARNVTEYKTHLANCDSQRQNDYDGRGNLSELALENFTDFFLNICIDQIDFMEKLMEPKLLKTRILLWAKEENQLGKLPPQSVQILEAVLNLNEIPRGEIPGIINVSDRHGRRLTAQLIALGVLRSDSPKSPLKLAFPATLVHRWMPGLFPSFS